MELQIQDLVSSIKKEGVDAARAQADAILEEAKQKADAIIAAAQEEARKATENAQKEVASFKDRARVSAEQAKRDAVLSFKEAVQGEFKKILAADVKKTVSGETLAKLILGALGEEDPSKYAAEVNEVTEGLKGELAEKVKAGLEIRPSASVRSGFKLAMKDGSGYFDCTEEEITSMLMPFFSELNI